MCDGAFVDPYGNCCSYHRTVVDARRTAQRAKARGPRPAVARAEIKAGLKRDNQREAEGLDWRATV